MPLGALRRKDRAMPIEEVEKLLERATVGRIATVGADGTPYVVPVNFLFDAARRTLYFHHFHATGHLLENLAHSQRVCFEVDEAGPVVASGTLACDASQVYKSVVCFGRAGFVPEGEKEAVMQRLVAKYAEQIAPGWSFEPTFRTINSIVVVEVEIETVTGKERKPS